MKSTNCISYLGQMEKAEGSFPQLRTVKEKQDKEDKVSVVVQWLSVTQGIRKRGERWRLWVTGEQRMACLLALRAETESCFSRSKGWREIEHKDGGIRKELFQVQNPRDGRVSSAWWWCMAVRWEEVSGSLKMLRLEDHQHEHRGNSRSIMASMYWSQGAHRCPSAIPVMRK